jgi:DNA-binding NtrC family response regulator
VIDDEKNVLDTVVSILGRKGYKVLQESDPKAGVELFKSQASEIDAVVLDLTMPGLSGEEVLREIRAIRADVSVVLMSGYSETELMACSEKHGLAGVLQKPFSANQLVDVIAGAVASSLASDG